jgi:tetratricopeptide (TPR) repeat protein
LAKIWYDDRMRGVRVLLLLLPLLVCASAHAQTQPQRLERAKQLYGDGRKAYEVGDYQKAYDAFKESYLLSHEPALLYNISSALQGLRRPHEAAEALRSFLRLRSDDPERPQIEERIRALEEEQRLLDNEKARTAPPVPVITAPPPHISLTPTPVDNAVVAGHDADWERRKKKKIIAAVVGSILGAAVVGTAIGRAVGLSGSSEPSSMGSIGPIPGAR